MAGLDNTPPLIIPTVIGSLGNNGWYVSTVTVSWSVVDNESAISAQTGCGPVTIGTDNSGQTLTCNATSAGGMVSQSVTIKRDATAPTIVRNPGADTCSLTGTDAWCRGTQTAGFTVSDAVSGLAAPLSGASANFTQSTSTEGNAVQISSGQACDVAGNCAGSISAGLFKLDATAPTLSPVVSPNPVFLNGSASAAPNASDNVSGVASASCGAVSTSTVGSKSVTCTATDNAGNTTSASASYTVLYQFVGFSPPVNSGVVNVAKAGQTIPLKWQLLDANNIPVTTLGSATVTTIASNACSSNSSMGLVETYAPGSTGQLLNLGGGNYHLNWATPKTFDGTCQMLQLNLGDSGSRTAIFLFSR